MEEFIKVRKAKENNLKDLSVDIPKNKLVIITGLSGSGKSSLAFDTIYAEGQRRYLESLSSYARQFLGGNEKPNVESITGLSPAISIDQKTTSHNPRSTVGTVTEIYDYLRLLWARIGQVYCVNNHGIIQAQTVKKIVDKIISKAKDKAKIQILSPIAKEEKGTFKNEFEKFQKAGFLRIKVDNHNFNLDEPIELDKQKKHNIDLIIDRIVLNKNDQTIRSRIYDSIEVALKYGKGLVKVETDDDDVLYSENFSCKICGFTISELEPRLFSFNSPVGACNKCNGLGFTFEPNINLIIPDWNKSINEGGIDYFKNTVNTTSLDWQRFGAMLSYYKINKDIPLSELKPDQIDIIMNGSKEEIPILMQTSTTKYSKQEYSEGVGTLLKRRHLETNSESAREYYSKYMSEKKCDGCNGNRLNEQALAVKINNLNIVDLCDKSIDKIITFFVSLELNEEQKQISELVLKEIINRLNFLDNVGLTYLTLSRSAATLSGGESQRIRLATQIGSQLTGVLYVLDEPSIGLHQRDNDKLIATMKKMVSLGNTLLVVEHDEDTMWNADYLIDIGPGAGINGGKLISQGTPKEVANDSKSLTGQYLSGKKFIPIPKTRRAGTGHVLELIGANGNNLKNVTVKIPLGKFVAVTGVSGSGKSTLINETLVKAIEKYTTNPFANPASFKTLKGTEWIDKVVSVTQAPIGRTPRSNPATYVGVFDDIREVFAMTDEARARGYEKGRFSFNVKGGRCEHCQGDGFIKIEMHFLPDVFVKCEECDGKRYNEETLEIKYKNKSIYDVLNMDVDQAITFFEPYPNIHKILSVMQSVGLGYIKLNTPATALSGGEAQRIKLSKFLQKKSTGSTVFVFDEPTTGLHTDDVMRLINAFNSIVDRGDTVIVIEHNLHIIKVADYIIDLGYDGGDNGGQIIATGTPEQIVANNKNLSYTANYLKKILNK